MKNREKSSTDPTLHMGATLNNASTIAALSLHTLCGLSLTTALWVAHHLFSVNLVSDPDSTLLIIWAIHCPIVLFLYSLHRIDSQKCSYLKAIGRGVVGLLAGALLLAMIAISLGAPVGTKYMKRTIYWSFLMSLFTFTPAAAIYGSSLIDWRRIFAYTRPAGSVDFMVCFPAHGAMLGSWFGAWPMPLDWERPWQEWPICVTYGALLGYGIGMVASVVFVFHSNKMQHIKKE